MKKTLPDAKMMILGDDMEYMDAPDPFKKLPVLWYYAINKHENKFYQRMRATAPPMWATHCSEIELPIGVNVTKEHQEKLTSL